MEYRAMERLGVKPSLLGFGCMRLPKLEDGGIDEREAEKLLDYAILNGVNYIDTAYVYHEGKCEAFVGRVLKKYPRELLLLATKLPMSAVRSLAQAKEIFFEQLQRLQVDYVDFYLLHALNRGRWNQALELEIVAFLEEMQHEGKIRFLGFSFHDQYEVFEEILSYRTWDFCQIQLNYIDTEHQAGLRGYWLAEKMDVPVLVMEPVKGGSLAALPKPVEGLFTSYDAQRSMASWALRWVAGLPQVRVVLSGMSAFSQVQDNLAVFTPFEPLGEAERSLVERAVEAIKARMKNGCTGCAYCMPCPHGVNIPACFKVWNERAMYENYAQAQSAYYKALKEPERADRCRGCGRCETACPQGLKIRRDLFRAAVELSPGKILAQEDCASQAARGRGLG